MRKRFNLIFFSLIILIIGIVNLILFLLIKPEKQTTEFWVSWAIFTCGNILFDIVYLSFIGVRKINIATVPSLLLTISGINFVLLLINLIFALSGVNLTSIIITNSILFFIAIVTTVYLFLTCKNIEDNETKQAKKVFYIRDLASDIEAYANIENDKDVKEALIKLADDIKYSDPTSNDLLEDIELDIKIGVASINELLNKENKKEEALSKIKEVKDLLVRRNLKVKNLK